MTGVTAAAADDDDAAALLHYCMRSWDSHL